MDKRSSNGSSNVCLCSGEPSQCMHLSLSFTSAQTVQNFLLSSPALRLAPAYRLRKILC